MLRALAAKGGLVGIHGSAAVISKRYRKWLADHPEEAAASVKALFGTLGYGPGFPRPPGDRGEYIERFDKEFAEKWRARADFKDPPELAQLAPTTAEWAEHVDYVIKTVGVDHVAIGLDMVGGRDSVPKDDQRLFRIGGSA